MGGELGKRKRCTGEGKYGKGGSGSSIRVAGEVGTVRGGEWKHGKWEALKEREV